MNKRKLQSNTVKIFFGLNDGEHFERIADYSSHTNITGKFHNVNVAQT